MHTHRIDKTKKSTMYLSFNTSCNFFLYRTNYDHRKAVEYSTNNKMRQTSSHGDLLPFYDKLLNSCLVSAVFGAVNM